MQCTAPFIHCSPPVGDRVEWAEERACLNHNLVSLRQALQDREAQAEADEAATSSRLKASQNDFDRSARERVSLAKAIDSLRVELAEALLLAAATRRGSVSGGRDEVRERHQVRERQAVSGSVMVSRDGDVPVEEDGVGGHDEVGRPDGGARRGEPARTGAQEPEPEPDTGEESEQGADVCGRSEVTAEGQGEEAAQAGSDHRVVSTGGGGAAAVVMRTRDRWLDGGFEGAIGESFVLAYFPSPRGVCWVCKPLRVVVLLDLAKMFVPTSIEEVTRAYVARGDLSPVIYCVIFCLAEFKAPCGERLTCHFCGKIHTQSPFKEFIDELEFPFAPEGEVKASNRPPPPPPLDPPHYLSERQTTYSWT